MITEEMVFSKDAINIFTDASILKLPQGKFLGCPGYAVVNQDTILEYGTQILGDTTSNNSEIKAVRMGVLAAARYQNYKYIRLFSDSQLCIFGLRDRIYNWVKKIQDGKLCGYDGNPIKNQEIFLEIAYLIVQNQIRVEFFHQRGHISLASGEALQKAKEAFIQFNNLQCDVDINLIAKLSYYNNMVDEFTRQELSKHNVIPMTDAYQFKYIPFDINGYYNLTHNIK